MSYFLKNENNSKQIIPIQCWTKDIENEALMQIYNLASLPFAFHHVAIMPDVHAGYGMPIGGVLATNNVIIPNAVGVDIGCGMCAVQTSLTDISIEQIKKILGGSKEYRGGIRAYIPIGFSHQFKKQEWEGFDNAPNIKIIQQEIISAQKQLGTLGGGNHFIEIQKGSDGFIWIMLHSGSRNFGYKIANFYNQKAQDLCLKWYSNIPSVKGEDGLAFLPIKTDEGHEYLSAMEYALSFALENRLRMIKKCKEAFTDIVDCTFGDVINIHHNYVACEHHFGKNVWVHRKGATRARAGEIGIIPGSQGTKSYIVGGLGNINSFMSCSHGAGRAMSRTKAREILSLDEEKNKLDTLQIVHSMRNKSDLDEAPSAYKNINQVMEDQKDLVTILIELTPLAVVKG